MLVFTGVYVCVKAKLTFVSFFSFFFCTFPLIRFIFIAYFTFRFTGELSSHLKLLGSVSLGIALLQVFVWNEHRDDNDIYRVFWVYV